jgi:tetratricopeptide (TPR) repeat protein
VVLALAALVALPACTAARAAAPVATRPFVVGAAPDAAHPVREDLESWSARVRALSVRAAASRVAARPLALEAADPGLRAALAALAADPGAAAHRAVAAAYQRLGVFDCAHDHLTAALAIDPRDGASYDARARVWRAWGLPHVGLADAHRAIYYRPESAAARNTLGTLLQAMGQLDAAREAYGAALQLDPGAAWAFSNLCALEIGAGRHAAAAAACERALGLDPALFAARRNRALLEAGSQEAGRQPGRLATPRSPAPPPH